MLPRVNLVRTDSADYLLFSTDDAVSRTIYSTGSWASPLLTISQLFYQGADAPLVIDIGANLGAYAVPVAREIAAAGGVVHAFEPQRIVYYQLCGNAFLNRLDNLHTFNIALGDHDGKVDIPAIDYGNSKNIGGFSLDQQAHGKLDSVAVDARRQAHQVPICRLDSLHFPKAPALIKIDVEGLELQVLKGAVGFLEQHNFPPLLLEAWNLDWFKERRQALLDFLLTLGYGYFAVMDEIIAQHPKHGRQVNFSVDAAGVIQMARVR